MTLETEPLERKPLVLVVDDTPGNLSLISSLLRDDYMVKVAPSGERALKILEAGPLPDIVLLDVMMPGLSGYEVCERLKENPRTRDIPVLFLTAKVDLEDETRGFACGAVDYIHKPVNPPTLLARVKSQLQIRASTDLLKNQSHRLDQEVERRIQARTNDLHATVMVLAALAEGRSLGSVNHLQRTQHFVHALAMQCRRHDRFAQALTDAYIESLRLAVPLQDIGNFGVADQVLFKPEKLTEQEFEAIKAHTTVGAAAIDRIGRILNSPAEFLSLAKEIALSHQEKWDGSGYPQGLSGDAIPLAARLVAVADVYDVLVSRRVYKAPISHEEAIKVLADGRATHFDPDIVDAFLEIETEIRKIALSFPDP